MIALEPRHSLVVAALLVAGPVALADTEAYFSPNGGGAAAVARHVAAADETIDVAMYSISTGAERPIMKALADAVDRGVRVRLILDDGHLDNRDKADDLAEIGVHVYSVTKTLHEKFALIDARRPGRKLINGSANWSHGAEHTYSENTVVFGDGYYHLVWQFQQEFDHLLAEARPLSPGAADEQAPSDLFRPWWRFRYDRAVFTRHNHGPGDPGGGVVTETLIEAMEGARESILIDVAHFDRRPLADALIAVHRERPELRVEVLLDQGELGWGGQSWRLEWAGIDVRYKTYSLAYHHPQSQLMHHKTLIVDGETLVTGSFNWSQTAEFSNYENVVVLTGRKNRSLVRAFVAEHERLWDMGRAQYADFRAALEAEAGDPRYKRYVPVHYNTDYFDAVMTITRAESDPIWAVTKALKVPDGRGARFWDREQRVPYDPPGSHEDDVERLLAEWGPFLEPRPQPAEAEEPAEAPAAAPAEAAAGLSGALGGLGE